jgi:hypothetical protein
MRRWRSTLLVMARPRGKGIPVDAVLLSSPRQVHRSRNRGPVNWHRGPFGGRTFERSYAGLAIRLLTAAICCLPGSADLVRADEAAGLYSEPQAARGERL